ncbi:MAG: phage minor head protein [Armatimonadota bacterium]
MIALKSIDVSDWAGDRGEEVVGQMQRLQAELQSAFAVAREATLAALPAELPEVDLVDAAVDLVSWRLTWLELDNLLRTTFYGEAERTRQEVIDDYLAWFAGRLSLDDAQWDTLQQRLTPLASADAASKAFDPGALWAAAKAGVQNLIGSVTSALTTWMDLAAISGGQSVFDAIGLGISFTLPDQRAIDFLKEYALSFSERTARGSEEKIRKVLLAGLAKGRSAAETATEIEAAHETLHRFESERIARTEIIRAHAEGQLSALRELEVQQKTWTATEDERTCSVCGPRDGQVYAIDDDTVSIPAHPGCRCTWDLGEDEFERLRAELLG